MIKIFFTTIIIFFCGYLSAMDNLESKVLIRSTYYFTKTEICTIIIDYYPSITKLDKENNDNKSLILIRSMLKEYISNGEQRCLEAPMVKILAALIPDKDIYGRPDFGGRINLLKLELPSNKIGAILNDHNNISLSKIQSVGSVELYFNKKKY